MSRQGWEKRPWGETGWGAAGKTGAGTCAPKGGKGEVNAVGAVKNSFVLYHDLREPLALLSDEERGQLLSAIFEYSMTGALPSFTGATALAFAFVRTALDRDAAAWEDKVRKRREAGRTGGRPARENRADAAYAQPEEATGADASYAQPEEATGADASYARPEEANGADASYSSPEKANGADASYASPEKANGADASYASPEKAKEANAFFAFGEKANKAEHVPVPEHVPELKPEHEHEHGHGHDPVPVPEPMPESGYEKAPDRPARASRFKPPDVEEVRAYVEERGSPVDPQHFVDYYEARGWVAGRTRMKDWRAAVRTWERNREAERERPKSPVPTDEEYREGWL